MMIDWKQVQDPEALSAERLALHRDSALSQLAQSAARALNGVSAAIPLSEQLGWAAKEQAARALLAGEADAGQTDLLEIEATEMGEDPKTLAQKVVKRSMDHAAALARLTGQRRRIAHAIEKAKDVAEIDAVLEASLQSLG